MTLYWVQWFLIALALVFAAAAFVRVYVLPGAINVAAIRPGMWFPNGVGTRAVVTFILVLGLVFLVGVVMYALIWRTPDPELVGKLAEQIVTAFTAAVTLAVGHYLGNRDKAVNGHLPPGGPDERATG